MSLVFAYQIFKLYPKFRKKLLIFGSFIGIMFIFVVVIFYWKNSLSRHTFSHMIQSYTNGFYSIYQSRNVYIDSKIDVISKIGMFLWGDGLSNLIVISRFATSSTNTSDLYNFYLYGKNFNGGMVVPLVSQAAYYFSILIGPLFSFGCIYLMKKLEYFSKNWKREYYYKLLSLHNI